MVISKPHYQVTAGIIWKDGKILIARRPKGKHLAGKWEFPGGKREEGESLAACLRREIQEELGLNIKIKGHLVTIAHEYEDRKITLHVFNCDFSGKGPGKREYDEFQWVDPSELDKFEFPPPDKEILKLLN